MTSPRSRTLAGALLTLLLVAVALAPLASASHLTTMYTRNPVTGDNLDPGSGAVYEDDGAEVHQPGTNLHGLTNRIMRNASDVLGGSALILDTQFFFGDNPFINPNYYLDVPFNGKQHVVPGEGTFITFHGWWTDLNTNGIIELYHDADNNPADEFKWRGTATSENLAMVFFTIPNNNAMGAGFTGGLTPPRTTPGAWHDESNPNATGVFADRTGMTETQQKWVLGNGYPNYWYDEGFIMTLQTITIVDADRIPGSGQIVNVRQAEALVDVDVYSSYSTDIESLWLATVKPVGEMYTATVNEGVAAANAAIATAIGAYNEQVWPPVNDTLQEHLWPVYDDVYESYIQPLIQDSDLDAILGNLDSMIDGGISTYMHTSTVVLPYYMKEPNHGEDDFGGRASFGGLGDHRGTGNLYTGYQQDPGLWFDSWAELLLPYAANVQVNPANFAYGFYGDVPYHYDPFPSTSEDANNTRGSSIIMGFTAAIVVWHDKNLDGWLGVWCDPEESEEWDADRNDCRTDPSNYYVDDVAFGERQYNGGSFAPPGGFDGEISGVCGVTNFRDGVIRMTPVGGPWPLGTVVMREHYAPTAQIWTQTWEDVSGSSDSIDLRWNPQCLSTSRLVSTIDTVLFPRGNTGIGIRTESVATLPKFIDEANDVEILNQVVKDVDYYHPSM